jgi:hypothetical protein
MDPFSIKGHPRQFSILPPRLRAFNGATTTAPVTYFATRSRVKDSRTQRGTCIVAARRHASFHQPFIGHASAYKPSSLPSASLSSIERAFLWVFGADASDAWWMARANEAADWVTELVEKDAREQASNELYDTGWYQGTLNSAYQGVHRDTDHAPTWPSTVGRTTTSLHDAEWWMVASASTPQYTAEPKPPAHWGLGA